MHGWLLIKIWSKMHEQVCHADARYPSVGKRWKGALKKVEEHHFAERGLSSGRATCRFVNRYTAHRWL